MTEAPLSKVAARTAIDVCRNFELRKEARALLREGQSPSEFIDALLAENKTAAAIDFLAHALPPRETIWWGCLCVEHVSGSRLSGVDTAAHKTAVRWVLDPSDENRRGSKSPGEAAGLRSPAGGLAMAANWTGGSLAPPLQTNNPKVPQPPPVPPGPFVPAKAVSGAILLATTRGDPGKIPQHRRAFVELGIGVAEGRFTWPEKRKPERTDTGRTWRLRETRT